MHFMFNTFKLMVTLLFPFVLLFTSQGPNKEKAYLN